MAEPIKFRKKPAPAVAAADTPFKNAVTLFEAGKVVEAMEGFKQVLRHDISHSGAWLNLGTALRKLGKHEASLACTKRAIELKPDDSGMFTNLGNCLVDLDRLDEAVAAHEKALALKPDDFLVRRNYSIALREAGRFEQALPVFASLAKARPDDVSILWEYALTHLYLGDFRKGWEAFEVRWKLPNMRERTSSTAKRWRGEDISGKTVLIYEEQGFGDTILCSRYIPLIHAKGGKVIVECKKPLHHLFSTLQGIVQIAEAGQIMTGFDYHIPMMSLPGIFGTDLSNVPPPPSYRVITAPPPEAARLLALGKGRLKVGIVWSGSTTFANNRKRAVSAERFLPLAEIPGVQLYSLQKGACEPELKDCGGEGLVLELGPHVNDFSETASVLKHLDLVIMTDSAVAHLAGSLGVPVWNLLCYRPYWLYGSDREDCAWYPSMRLFRQQRAGDWDGVFERVAAELAKIVRPATKKSHIKNVDGRWGKCHFFEQDEYIGKSLLHYGEYNPDETEFILDLAKKAGKDKTVLDIGANIGVISQALEHEGFKVEAFEPQPEVFKLLTQNIKSKAHNVALGSKAGITAMPKLRYDQPGNFGGVECGTGSRSMGIIDIPVKRLDDYHYDNIGLIKIDVEGFEEMVLRGAAKTITRCSPVLYLEDDRKEKRKALHALLRELGYKWEHHQPALFRKKNFFGKKENIWGRSLASQNIVCYR